MFSIPQSVKRLPYTKIMQPSEFKRVLDAQKDQVKRYVSQVFPDRAGFISLRFINGNFRAQGWQGSSFQPWKPIRRKGTILVKTGALRRGTYFSTSNGMAHVINNVKYAAVHNNGFNGTVQVRGFKRRIIEAKKVETGRLTKSGNMRMKTVHSLKGYTDVKGHSRKMNIPKRQFMPHDGYDSPVLVNAIKRDIIREFHNIFK